MTIATDWCSWRSEDIVLLTKDPLDPERWAKLSRYVNEVLKPPMPTWPGDDGRLGFGFVGVGDFGEPTNWLDYRRAGDDCEPPLHDSQASGDARKEP